MKPYFRLPARPAARSAARAAARSAAGFFALPFVAVAGLLLSGCAMMGTVAITPGEPEASFLAKMGAPVHRYQDGQDRLLEYGGGTFGQFTWIARIGPDGTVKSFEQVLTQQKFATLQPGVATKAQVLHTLGAPTETSYLTLRDMEVWSYAYREANNWDSMMHVHFDKNGVVQQMMNGPDPHRMLDGGKFGMR